jgi:hypothetical protein
MREVKGRGEGRKREKENLEDMKDRRPFGGGRG